MVLNYILVGRPWEISRQYLLLQTVILQLKVAGCPWKRERAAKLRGEREKNHVFLTLLAASRLSLSFAKKISRKTSGTTAWNSSDCFESFSPLNNNRMKFRLLGLGYVTYRTAMNDPSVNSRVGFPYGRVLYESRHERVMAVFWEYLRLKYFGPNDTLRQWYNSKDLGAEPYLV